MSLETMTKLASTTVGVGGTASITFSNIPQNYTDLKILISARTTFAYRSDDLSIAINGNTSLITNKIIYGNGANAFSTSNSPLWVAEIQGDSSTSSVFSNTEVYFSNYSGNTYKAFSADSAAENNATNNANHLNANLWSNSAPITSLTMSSGNGGTLLQHSTFTLYGIKNMAKSMGVPGWSTGGALSFDGTYFYHAFTSSGTFTPSKPLLADILVVAGGGGGGAGGGGAGGLLEYGNQSLLAIPYFVAVGSGGAAGNGDTIQGTNGSNSAFGFLTAAVGGGGGGALSTNLNGLSGGSGGGGGASDASGGSGGAATSGQGNAGGSGSSRNGGIGGGGGGGGAGAAGGSASSGAGGNGGAGTTSATITAMGNSTGLGVLSSSSRYFAGGGGGGVNVNSQTSGGLGGGGAGYKQTGSVAGAAGTANTGGGGGAGWNQSGSYTGGSGVVIIRYKG